MPRVFADPGPAAFRLAGRPGRTLTTDPVPRRTMRSSRLPSSLLIVRTCTARTILHLLRGSQDQTRRR
jgi:hypothetical protein